ncbi:MAG: prepilin peptidase [Deltaproteobacteria bacterium]|nr:prepilin peptidase [Deltaproteobacteria bacterium]
MPLLYDNIILIIPFLFGAVVGSFLNVCIYRIPAGLSVVSPASRCSSCGAGVAFYDNIPILSYIILRGRCRACRAPFSVQYPFVEALTGGFAALIFHLYGPSPEFFVYFVFTAALIVITFIDLEHRIIPDVISLPGIPIGFAASFFIASPGWMNSAIGAVLGGGFLLIVSVGYYLLAKRSGMGGGDIKLLAMIGAFLGWKGVVVTVLLSSFVGAVIGGALMVIAGKKSRYAIPFGPFLAFGALVYLFIGDILIEWYLRFAFGG